MLCKSRSYYSRIVLFYNAVFVSIFCYTSGQGQIEQVNVYTVLYATVEIQCTTPLSSLYLAIPTDRPFSRISLWEFT